MFVIIIIIINIKAPFSMFLNDFKGFLTNNNVHGPSLPFAVAHDVYIIMS